MMDGLHACNDYIPNYQLNHPQVTQCEMDGGSSVEWLLLSDLQQGHFTWKPMLLLNALCLTYQYQSKKQVNRKKMAIAGPKLKLSHLSEQKLVSRTKLVPDCHHQLTGEWEVSIGSLSQRCQHQYWLQSQAFSLLLLFSSIPPSPPPPSLSSSLISSSASSLPHLHCHGCWSRCCAGAGRSALLQQLLPHCGSYAQHMRF